MKRIKWFSIFLFSVFFMTFISCQKSAKNDGQLVSNVKYQQYLVEGKRLYTAHCANCHQKDGTGLRRLYPPLKNSDFLRSDYQRMICLIKYGYNERILVNGIEYFQPMPGNPLLTNLEIAEIATYTIFSFANENIFFDYSEINKILVLCDSLKTKSIK